MRLTTLALVVLLSATIGVPVNAALQPRAHPMPALRTTAPGRQQGADQILHAFKGGDGLTPAASLIVDGNGALYGTAESGGSSACLFGCGTVFKLTPNGSGYSFKVIYTFHADGDGYSPSAALLIDKSGALYGTTLGTTQSGSDNNGTVFKLTPQGSGYQETVLHAFTYSDGANPQAALIADGTGALYGTTLYGGAGRSGTVFKLTPNGSQYTESVLYSFKGHGDGAQPYAGVVMDKNGVLYGTTPVGGKGYGTVFALTPKQSTYTKSELYRFAGGTDGAYPHAGLLMDSSGVLYGVTSSGGNSACRGGCGTVFALTPSGSGYSESILYRFGSHGDGAQPAGTLIGTGAAALYGTTDRAGDHQCGGECGIAFKLTRGTSGYSETILHRFTGGTTDGADVDAGLVAGANGVLFGTTWAGGSTDWCYWGGKTHGCGTVFELQP